MPIDDTKTEELKKRALDYIKSYKAGMDILQQDRAKCHSFYMGEPLGNEIEGRSKVVMSDVADTIEWIMPTLMRIFYGGQDVAKVSPVGPEDEEGAKLMEEKINFDIQKGMPGFKLFYTWFKDALLYKLGVIKYEWQKETKKGRKKTFNGASPVELDALHSSDDFTVESVDTVNQPMGIDGAGAPMMSAVHNVTGREVKRISKPMAYNLPPEEFIFDIRAKSIAESDLVAHRKSVKKKSLVKYGKSEDEINAEIARFDSDPNLQARFQDLGGINFLTENKDSQDVYIYECCLNDYDEEGNAIPYKLTIAGDMVLDIEENTYETPNYCGLSPILMQHRLIGRGLAEILMDIQKLRTALVRYILDNVYFQNNGMNVVNPWKISLDDMMNGNRPGGIIKTLSEDVNPSEAIYPVPIKPLPPHIMNIIEYVETVKENRTGVTRYNQGLDANSLNKTAHGISQIMSAAQQRVELIARIFAETGVKDFFQALIEMNLKFYDAAVNIRINNEWQKIDPKQISGNFDLTIDVGLGTGTKEATVQQMQNMLALYGNVAGMLGPATPAVFNPDNIKEIIKEIWENMGHKNSDKFVSPKQGVLNGQVITGTANTGVPGGPGGPGEPVNSAVLQGGGGAAPATAMGMPM